MACNKYRPSASQAYSADTRVMRLADERNP